jgi:Glycosyl hydrolases family 28
MPTYNLHSCLVRPSLYACLFVASCFSLAQTAQTAEAGRALANCRVRAYGAIGDGHTLETRAINAAVQDCHSRGGGTVVVEAGTYRTGTVRLLDNITLKLEPGATLLGSENLADYPHLARASEDRDTALIVAENAHNIAIIGEGTIDGNGRAFTDKDQPHFDPYFEAAQTRQGEALVARMGETREGPVHMRPRPGVLVLALHSDGIVLRDFHVIDSPNWGVKLMCSDHISVSGLDVRNNMMVPNNDALDVSASRNVTIANSSLEAGDDALVVGGPCADGWCQEPAENIAVSNVILRSRSAAIRIGPAARDVRNLTFENVIIRDSNRGINIQARAGEVVENLLFSNIVSETRLIDGPWWGSGEPVSMTVARWAYPPWPESQTAGRIRHVRFNSMIAKSQSPIVLYSTDPGNIEDVQFRDLTLTMQSSPLQAIMGGNLDLQPTTPKGLGLIRQDLSGIEAHNVRDLSLIDLQVHWEGAFPEFYQHAVHVQGFDGLSIDGFKGESSAPSYAALDFRQGKNLSIRNAHTTTGPLLDSKGVQGNTTGVPAKPTPKR